MKRSPLFMLCAGLSTGLAILGAVLSVAAWQRAGLPYNEQGHYFDGLVNYHQQSVLGYALAALAALLLAGVLAWVFQRIQRR
ncbi:MAG: hypothetical protein ACOY95_14570 [Pseudomonadota bacterium]